MRLRRLHDKLFVHPHVAIASVASTALSQSCRLRCRFQEANRLCCVLARIAANEVQFWPSYRSPGTIIRCAYLHMQEIPFRLNSDKCWVRAQGPASDDLFQHVPGFVAAGCRDSMISRCTAMKKLRKLRQRRQGAGDSYESF